MSCWLTTNNRLAKLILLYPIKILKIDNTILCLTIEQVVRGGTLINLENLEDQSLLISVSVDNLHYLTNKKMLTNFL